ncbi:hypothetical protein HPB50_026297 [Hyalomma asiaticum]|uniref:Uncharacterized protein n=1 Tax=Hyalomma asiaticum TaxID=266040 RepID=A0ACB7TMH7_HYAAI|nr:hypothetical protein HPB50_026297 [Hyalomma asiaticum]
MFSQPEVLFFVVVIVGGGGDQNERGSVKGIPLAPELVRAAQQVTAEQTSRMARSPLGSNGAADCFPPNGNLYAKRRNTAMLIHRCSPTACVPRFDQRRVESVVDSADVFLALSSTHRLPLAKGVIAAWLSRRGLGP